jgi:hypothetical protein
MFSSVLLVSSWLLASFGPLSERKALIRLFTRGGSEGVLVEGAFLVKESFAFIQEIERPLCKPARLLIASGPVPKAPAITVGDENRSQPPVSPTANQQTNLF